MKTVRDWAWSIWSHWVTSKSLLAGPLSSVSARLRLADRHKYLTRNQIHPIAEREGDWSAMSGFQQTMQMLNEGIVPTAMLVANDQMALGAMRAITDRAARWCGYLGSGIRRYRRQLVLYPAVNHHQTGFSPAGENQRGPLAETLSGPGGEEQSAVARLTGEKKTTLAPNTQTTSPRTLADSLMQLARQVSRLESGQ
jgi:hypothetical protein